MYTQPGIPCRNQHGRSKENPVPFAIVGAAGVGMLAYSHFQRRGRDHDPWSEEYRIGDEGLVSETSQIQVERIGEDFLDIVGEHPFIIGTAMFCMGLLGVPYGLARWGFYKCVHFQPEETQVKNV